METIKNKNSRAAVIMLVMAALITGVFLLSLNRGEIRIAPLDTLKTLFGAGTPQDELVLFEFRLPRMILAMIIGAGIAAAGAVWQGISQNDLADPGILGINAGAGFAVVLFIFFLQGSIDRLEASMMFSLPIFAFIGACISVILIYLLAWKKGLNPVRLVLVGIGVNAAFGAAILMLQLKMDPNDFMQATVWLSGNIWNANWSFVWATLPWIAVLLPFILYKARYLNVLNLGDQIAAGLGTAVEKERRTLLLAAAALSGACVAAGGNITFLGLVAPHIARRLVGPKHQLLIPASALTGALLFLLADLIGRNLLAPSEIPVGLVISVLGAPYFIYLLMKTN
ncbi:iron ABC transporter permease [Bacillus sonorensis]|uniref:Hydroxamate siderophore ABC transporter permease FhuG n=3 Tax=Bacillus sonorensis TaxID=119858 RepID=M5NZ38_9BACI|nr:MULTISPECIES: iron ABC transporter permease [Bacillus]TWK79414.1 Iron-uptake system permease protein FeuC [Bacillus paralicheniformis]ASB90751.1 Iron(3+)-hydroxamate import system permease protein FhuG [Bacillus sonorensis]EME73146.1 hydroxamate siderophore ABC transporter permease FhuG [Bacillus sonorensis L12]MBG9914148.1 iron ABC transporter permease [Bacillus sonorensis]MCZ0073037.1 iron ABC transporter permease [Bacillus sonorensis]